MVGIVDYQARWVDEFTAVGESLRTALGPLALRIDHIGSTSVAGLCSKDVIDVQVSVARLEPRLADLLARAGFAHRSGVVEDHVPPGEIADSANWAKLYFREPAGQREVHVHMRRQGASNQRYALLFRDFLRANSPAAAAYGEFKRRLAVISADTEIYADAKDPVCDLVMVSAEQWASKVGWAAGDSDA